MFKVGDFVKGKYPSEHYMGYGVTNDKSKCVVESVFGKDIMTVKVLDSDFLSGIGAEHIVSADRMVYYEESVMKCEEFQSSDLKVVIAEYFKTKEQLSRLENQIKELIKE